MPDAPDHLDPKEATEARLCAYLEGELAPAERVEIEKHLDANPQHRQLLIDLAQTREWMRSVPHESAPPELAEAFAAQMERSMLLDDRRPPGSTINQLPQYLMLAAIIVLILGLGGVIFVVLNGGKNYTMGPTGSSPFPPPPPSKSATTLPGAEDALSEPMKPAADTAARKGVDAPLAPVAFGTPPVVNDAAKFPYQVASAVSPKASDQVFNEYSDRKKVEVAMRDRNIATERRTVYLLVSTPAPAATSDQVRRFFANNQVVFDDDRDHGLRVTNQLAMIAPAGISENAMNNAGAGAAQNQQHLQVSSNSATTSPQQQIMQNAVRQVTASTQQSTPASTMVASDEIVYVGRGLTPLQLELLHGTLVTDGIDQTVKQLDPPTPPTTQQAGGSAETAKDPSAISKGQTLTVTVPQLIGPGIEKTNVVKVADDGTINLPMLDPLPAAGASTTELQDRVTSKYREANLIPAATVTVVVNKPATQPASQPAVAATTKPTTLPATSQPIATTQPADDGKIDVVVYLRKSN